MRNILIFGLFIMLSSSVAWGTEHKFVYQRELAEPVVLQLSLEQAKVTIEQSEGNKLILHSTYPGNITKPFIRQVENNYIYTELFRESLEQQNEVISSEIRISIPKHSTIVINGSSITAFAQTLTNDISIDSSRLTVNFEDVNGTLYLKSPMGRFMLEQLVGDLTIDGQRTYQQILDSNLNRATIRADAARLVIKNSLLQDVDFDIESGDINIENVKMHNANIQVRAGSIEIMLAALADSIIELDVETTLVEAELINSESAQFIYEIHSLGEITVNSVEYKQSFTKELNLDRGERGAQGAEVNSSILKIQSMTGPVHLTETNRAD